MLGPSDNSIYYLNIVEQRQQSGSWISKNTIKY
jgi:hypothetical protein